MQKRILSLLVLLMTAVTGARAQGGIVCTASDKGKVLCTDGSIYNNVSAATTAGKTAVAKILVVDTEKYKGLALALSDEGQMDHSAAKTACTNKNSSTPVTYGTWAIPSKDEWDQMISAAGGRTALRDGFNGIGGTNISNASEGYWSSTKNTAYPNSVYWTYDFGETNPGWNSKDQGGSEVHVRFCLRFDLPIPSHNITTATGSGGDGWTIPTSAAERSTVTISYAGPHRVKSVKAKKKTDLLSGVFSVSASKKVNFSKGNLRYASSKWSFFDNQYDYYTSYSADAWDKFGWSTSATTYGMNTSTDKATYSGDFVDWGATMGTGWFTLSSDEWTYLLNTRTSGGTVFGTSSARYAHATINTDVTGVNGMILFPDGVDIASTEVTTAGTVNNTSAYATKCTTAQWSALAAKGCVFLPAAGFRGQASVNGAGSYGYYWSSSPYTSDAYRAYLVFFSSGTLNPASYSYRNVGYSVRLVQATSDAAPANPYANAKLGDLFYSDGTFSTTLEAGKTPIGVIAYLGTDAFSENGTTVGGSAFVGHGLVMCLKNAASVVAWSTENVSKFLGQEVTSVEGLKRTTNVSGYTNTATLTVDEATAAKYPAAKAAKNYTELTAPTGTTGWFLPSAQQWVKMMEGLGGLADGAPNFTESYYDNSHTAADKWEAALSKAGSGNYDSMTSEFLNYWSSSEYSASKANFLEVDATSTGSWYGFNWRSTDKGDKGSCRVRPVLAF